MEVDFESSLKLSKLSISAMQPTGNSLAMWLLFVAAMTVGCGRSGDTYLVTGTVTLDSQPIKKGEILFVPEDRRLGPEAGSIVDGKYQCRVKAGKQKVQITASREVPGSMGQGFRGGPLLEESVAPEYNTETTLSVDVEPNDDNEFSFEVHSVKSAR
jgi:hypothetical protein